MGRKRIDVRVSQKETVTGTVRKKKERCMRRTKMAARGARQARAVPCRAVPESLLASTHLPKVFGHDALDPAARREDLAHKRNGWLDRVRRRGGRRCLLRLLPLLLRRHNPRDSWGPPPSLHFLKCGAIKKTLPASQRSGGSCRCVKNVTPDRWMKRKRRASGNRI